MRTWNVRKIALVVVMAAVVCVLTSVLTIGSPAKGYYHLGDIGSNFAALAFGPWIGALIAGGGMAISDLLKGFGLFAPGTLVIHGLQAVVVGYLGRKRKPWIMFLAALAGGVVVVVGYFLYEWPIEGIQPAVAEVPGNILQVITGLVGVPLYGLVLSAYPRLSRWAK